MILKMFWQDKWAFGGEGGAFGGEGGAFGGERWSFWGVIHRKGVAKKNFHPYDKWRTVKKRHQ